MIIEVQLLGLKVWKLRAGEHWPLLWMWPLFDQHCKDVYLAFELLFILLGSWFLGQLSAFADSLQDVLTIFVELQFADDDFAWMNTNWNWLTVWFLSSDSFDVDEVFESVNRCDFSLFAFVASSNDGNFIILSDWDWSNLSKVRVVIIFSRVVLHYIFLSIPLTKVRS